MKRRSPEDYDPPQDGLFAAMDKERLSRWEDEARASARLVAWPVAPPPVPLGETFEPELDRERLGDQYQKVQSVMGTGQWTTLRGLSSIVRAPEASVSARLRDMRRAGWIVERKRDDKDRGLWWYRATRKP